jgi:hypothetical protein
MLGGHADFDLHAEKIRREAGPAAGERHRLTRIPDDRDTDQVAVADDAVGRVEFDPSRRRAGGSFSPAE